MNPESNEMTTAGVSRRSMLKRSAGAAGVAMVATPMVQVVGIGPASAQDPSVPPPTDPPGECQDISNIQLVVSKDGVYYGLKYDPGDSPSFDAWSEEAPPANDCLQAYVDASGNDVVADHDVADDFNASAHVDHMSECTWRLRLPLPSGYTFVAGYIKYGNPGEGGCPPGGTATATYIEFSTV